jgi:rubrerythrin
MPTQYAIEEVFEMAIQLERNGEAFYTAAAKHSRQPQARKLLLEFAQWEQNHEKLFTQMRDDLLDTDYVDQGGQAAAYLQASVAGEVFQLHDKAMQALTGQATLALIIDMAIAMEKEAILFYAGLRDVVARGQDKIDEIIAEERRHIQILTDLTSL